MGVTLSFTGRISTDPVVKTIGEHTITTFTLITTKWVPGRGEREGQEKTSTHRIKAFGESHGKAFQNFLKNGDLIEFAAEIEYGSYEREGQKIYTTEFVIPPFVNVIRHSQAEKNRKPKDQ